MLNESLIGLIAKLINERMTKCKEIDQDFVISLLSTESTKCSCLELTSHQMLELKKVVLPSIPQVNHHIR